MTLINAITFSANISPVVLEICYCLDHMVAGVNKDAPYTATILLRHLIFIDKKRNIADLVFFDGGLNFQKAGKNVESKFPQVAFLCGSEHCDVLFFTYLSKI